MQFENPTNRRDCVIKRKDATALRGGGSRIPHVLCFAEGAGGYLEKFNQRFGKPPPAPSAKKLGRLAISSERKTPPRKAVASFRFMTQSPRLVGFLIFYTVYPART